MIEEELSWRRVMIGIRSRWFYYYTQKASRGHIQQSEMMLAASYSSVRREKSHGGTSGPISVEMILIDLGFWSRDLACVTFGRMTTTLEDKLLKWIRVAIYSFSI